MSLASFGVRKPVVSNLVMVSLLAAGLVLGLGMRREFFPEVDPVLVTVVAPYPGASPDEIEETLAIKIEDALEDLRGVKEITSTCIEGAATVAVEFVDGTNIDNAVAEVKREIDALQDLPDRSERIIVDSLDPKLPAISLTLYSDADERTMKNAILEIRDDLRKIPRMGTVTVSGTRTDEIAVEVSHDKLLEHNLSLPQISSLISAAMSEQPGGTVRSSGTNIAIRTVGAQERADEIRDIIVKSAPNGRPIPLHEVARVTESFADVDLRTRFNGKSAVSVTAFAEGDQDVVEIAELVDAYAAGRNKADFSLSMLDQIALDMSERNPNADPPPMWTAYQTGLAHAEPPPGTLETHNNIARFVEQRLELLSRNALWGGLLVFGTLMLLLAPRVAFWVTIGLIIALAGTLGVMRVTGMTLNFLTMFGLIIVLGLLVDDAIVVAENIKARHEKGESPINAAIHGTVQVEWPVVATVLTTICAFLPLRLIGGQFGDLLGAIPLVVIAALGVSLIESLMILPSHMAHSLEKAEKRTRKSRLARLADRHEQIRTRVIQGFLIPIYTRHLEWALRNRYAALMIAIAVVTASVGMVAGKRVEFVFIESADSETVLVNLAMPVGTPVEGTEEVVQLIEGVAGNSPEVKSMFTLVGAQQNANDGSLANSPHIGQVVLELHPIENRDKPSNIVIDDIRAELGEIPGIKSLRFEELTGGPAGPGITLTLVGDNAEAIMPAAREVADLVATYDAVHSVSNDADAGQRELRIELRPGARELGFTTDSIALQLRAAVFGLEAHTFAGNREDVDVRVMLDTSSRRSLAAIESMYVFTPDNRAVPLSEVAIISESTSYATIRRVNRERAITVQGDVFTQLASPETITTELRPQLDAIDARHPGVTILYKGRQQQVAESFETLPMGMGAAVLMIYVILAWLFQSYTQPFIGLSAVPFACIGVIWGHYLFGFNLTFLSVIGFVALTGIVVNDSLILTEFYNQKRTEGMSVHDALVDAGRARFRAIMLTTITTVLGLSPLMLEQSFQARFLIPMAITISFGLLSATAIILIVLPCMLLITQDIRQVLRYVFTGSSEEEHEAVPSAPVLDG
ncbi:MAG: efflux RND transporter permease subunit [Planctomycetota bacterium]|jgi:multidrug efflux pump subunit AcrB